MSTMRQTVSTVSTRNVNSDNNLDVLLDDLQSTISRSGSQRGMNGSVTGYREIRRTVKDDNTGESTTEYKIEYLHPANSTTHVTEMSNSDLNTSGYGTTGQNLSSYKEYKYNSSQQNTLESPRSYGRSEKMQQNINAFDSLLEDLHQPHKSYSKTHDHKNQLAISNTSSGIDSGLLEPVLGSSSGGGVIEERKFHEERREVRGGTGPRRELVFTGPKSRDPSPVPGYDQPVRPIRQELYRYEKTTSTRTIGNDGNILDSGDSGRRAYNEEVRTIRSPSPQYIQYRDHSPNRLERTETVTKVRDRSPSPGYGRTNQSYNYSSSSSHHESRSRTRTNTPPPPHRSPSPVSFIQPPPPPPPTTVRTSFKSSTSSTSKYDQNYHQGVPQPKFTEPNRTLTYSVSPPHHNVSSYKYSSSSYHHDDGSLKPRPFPVPSPTMEQQPPKKLDDLMASFTDAQDHHQYRSETTHQVHHSRSDSMRNKPAESAPAVNAPMETVVDNKVDKKGETKNITGPPVYYPKGGDLFVKKEESMTQASSAGGGGKYKAKAKYNYESGSKYKESSDTKMIPVCVPCPCCCAAPCSIM